jgi:hypothetical protein
MKKFVFIIITLLQILQANGQKKFNEGKVESILKINLLSPGIAYEAPLSNKLSLYSEVYGTVDFLVRNNFSIINGSSNKVIFTFLPAINEQVRFYYNGSERFKNNRRIEKNSMNYVATSASFLGGKKDEFLSSQAQIALLWGLQRNMASRFSLDFNFGIGLAIPTSRNRNLYYNTENKRIIESHLRLGIWLGKRK